MAYTVIELGMVGESSPHFETMACGTPVIAMRHGLVPAVVVDGRTGFICRSMAEMIASVQKVQRSTRV